ncbi:hypothetical protein PINS_up006300 [Pythium insidiosum]|nr:hypothetical protein PINS_up006300 [Pythium insidiosum]
MELSRILNDDHQDATDVPRDLDAAPRRVGKWTEKEERFALQLIKCFSLGAVQAPTGVSLRAFLAAKLCCSPMRISTKLAIETLGGERIAKRLGQKRFFPSDSVAPNLRQEIDEELRQLETEFRKEAGLPLTPPVSKSPSASIDSGRVRIGTWSDDEQAFALALINAFCSGLLAIPRGTTLRAFLAEQLQCSPMRISKKLATGVMGRHSVPKRLGSAVFEPMLHADPTTRAIALQELSRLHAACFSRQSVPQISSCISPRLAPPPAKPLPSINPASPLSKRSLPASPSDTLPSLAESRKKARLMSRKGLTLL